MPSYRVAREGEDLGVFTDAELVVALEEGRIDLNDDAWAEGMPEWVQVAELVDVEEELPAFEEPVAPIKPQPAPVRSVPIPQPAQPVVIKMPAPLPQQVYAPLPSAVPSVTLERGSLYGSLPAGAYGTPGIAIASLVLGVLSLVLCCITGLPAIVCGHLALGKIRRSGQTYSGEGVAIAGLVLGYLTTVLALIYLIMFLMGGGIAAGFLKALSK